MDEKDKFILEATHPIEELFVYISHDNDGGESIVVIQGKSGWFPLIGSDLKRALSLRPFAETVAERFGKKISLCRFSDRKDLTARHLPGLKRERGTWDKVEK